MKISSSFINNGLLFINLLLVYLFYTFIIFILFFPCLWLQNIIKLEYLSIWLKATHWYFILDITYLIILFSNGNKFVFAFVIMISFQFYSVFLDKDEAIFVIKLMLQFFFLISLVTDNLFLYIYVMFTLSNNILMLQWLFHPLLLPLLS